MSRVRLDRAFFRNHELEGSERSGSLAFFADVADSKSQDELVVVRVRV